MKTINLVTICILSLFSTFGNNCHAQDEKRALKVTSKLLWKNIGKTQFFKKMKKKLVFKSKKKVRRQHKKVESNKNMAKNKVQNNVKNDQVANRIPSSIKETKNEKAELSYSINPLKGKANLTLEKAFINGSVNLKSFKKISATMKKDISALKIQTVVHYQVNENTWEASINKNINDNISTRVTANQNSEIKSGVYFNYSF